MKAIKNIHEKNLEMPFEGKTYQFPKGETVMVGDNLYKHLKKIWELCFDFDVAPPKNKPVSKVRFKKTPVLTQAPPPQADMVANKDPGFEAQGTDFYGEGIEIDSL